jgi:hypothetical protein
MEVERFCWWHTESAALCGIQVTKFTYYLVSSIVIFQYHKQIRCDISAIILLNINVL